MGIRMSGTLWIVATPIGNLEDITLRAIRILREADRIACEDTRQTRKLLDHFGIATPSISYHEHNESARAAELVAELEAGHNIALVSDAGTPLINDPGYRLVAMAREHGVTVSPVPGPSAILAALSASGLPTDAFEFLGFLPPKSGRRRHILEERAASEATLVFYETPHRIVESLEDIAAVLGRRPVVLARELTKLHEEFLRGTAAELHEELSGRPSIRGEFTLMIAKGDGIAAPEEPLGQAVERLIAEGVPRMDALKREAKRRGLSKREAYRMMEETRTE